MPVPAELEAHLQTCATTLCRCWLVRRQDGTVLGFSDHDRDITFDDVTFRAGTGLTAAALEQSSGLSVDNSAAAGALSDASITEADLRAGRYDGAEVHLYLVNWEDVAQRHLQFRGTLGEIRHGDGAFEAELRGLTEQLNQPKGRLFQSGCGTVLGSASCGFDVATPGYTTDLPVLNVVDETRFQIDAGSFSDRWFERGRLEVVSGAAKGLVGLVKRDRIAGQERTLELWQSLRAPVEVGDVVRVQAGCDGRVETCKVKFNNLLNFRGFPTIPGEDWLMAYPKSDGENDGGPLR